MELDNKTCKLVAELEHIIGSECYNPNSYDGWNDIEGCSFRYPINIPNEKGEYKKIRGNINTSCLIDENQITPQAVTYMKYRFGSNELFIGKGIINILTFLEQRYDLNFNELENTLTDQDE